MKRNMLKAKMAEKEKSNKDCSKALGMSDANYSRKMNGLNPLSLKQVNVLSTFLDLTPAEMIDIFLN